MKKILLGIIALCIMSACSQNPTNVYKIKGALTGAKDGDVVTLMHGRQRDSAMITNGKFVFNFTMENPDIINLVPPGGGMTLRMFVQPGEVKIAAEAGALANATLSGDGVKDWIYYTSKTKTYDEKARAVHRKMMKQEELTEEDHAILRTAQEKSREALIEVIRTHPDSPLSGFLLNVYLTSQSDYALGKELYEGLSEKGKETHYAKMFKETSDRQGKLEESKGRQAPAFTLIDKDGQNFSLSDYEGKYLLLDFWGSWCGPCRQSHPHLVELYDKYKSKNFDVVGLAHERDSLGEKWLQAIEADELSWRQANLTTNSNGRKVLDDYSVKAFPTKILISPKGEIITFYEGGTNEIDNKLKEIFGM
ncbi:MAG: AhpC/TSA family protein [Dysgonamonadaceae bacterium]|jgi:thiol-disulfide isomerase/thioredoxin|nr:AhpC/TSA family protein [Dysgonamonadaceae bacterium]